MFVISPTTFVDMNFPLRGRKGYPGLDVQDISQVRCNGHSEALGEKNYTSIWRYKQDHESATCFKASENLKILKPREKGN